MELSILFGGISALSAVVAMIVIIRKGGSKGGSLETTLQAVALDVKDIKSDMISVKSDITEIKMRNAAKDVESMRDRECLQDVKLKVEKHDTDIHEIRGAVSFISEKIDVRPKRAAKAN